MPKSGRTLISPRDSSSSLTESMPSTAYAVAGRAPPESGAGPAGSAMEVSLVLPGHDTEIRSEHAESPAVVFDRSEFPAPGRDLGHGLEVGVRREHAEPHVHGPGGLRVGDVDPDHRAWIDLVRLHLRDPVPRGQLQHRVLLGEAEPHRRAELTRTRWHAEGNRAHSPAGRVPITPCSARTRTSSVLIPRMPPRISSLCRPSVGAASGRQGSPPPAERNARAVVRKSPATGWLTGTQNPRASRCGSASRSAGRRTRAAATPATRSRASAWSASTPRG